MTWATVAVGVGSAALSYYGSTQATNAAKDANKKNSGLSQQQYNNSLMMMEPNRMLGYQAGADLSNLYGWATPGYTSGSDLISGYGSGGSGTVAGSVPGNPKNDPGGIDPIGSYVGNALGLGGGKTRYGGTINPATGTVDVANGHSYQDQALTHYLRTGEWTLTGKKSNDLKAQIDQLRASGWTYDPATGKGSTAGQQSAAANGLGAQPAGQPGNMDRFFTSPDYQFRLGESIKASDQSAAARGGALSGNALRANTALAGNLASGEYNNYVNNLFRAMGYGQNATQDTVNSGNTYVNQQGALNQQMGDIRATGHCEPVRGCGRVCLTRSAASTGTTWAVARRPVPGRALTRSRLTTDSRICNSSRGVRSNANRLRTHRRRDV